MPIGQLVDFSWAFKAEAKEIGEIKKGWYRIKGKQVKAPYENDNANVIIPVTFTIVTEAGGFKGETIVHRFCQPGEGSAASPQAQRMWITDQRNFGKVLKPTGKAADFEKLDLDVVEGMELWAYLEPGSEYQGQRRPQVGNGRWATELPEGQIEGPAAA